MKVSSQEKEIFNGVWLPLPLGKKENKINPENDELNRSVVAGYHAIICNAFCVSGYSEESNKKNDNKTR